LHCWTAVGPENRTIRAPWAGVVVVVLLGEVEVAAEIVDVVDVGASVEVVVGASVVDEGGVELEWLLLHAARPAAQTPSTKPKRRKRRIGES